MSLAPDLDDPYPEDPYPVGDARGGADGPFDPGSPGRLPPRPPPPRAWRDRLDDLAASGWPSAPRVAAIVAALAVVAVLGWRLLAPPAPPPEVAIPFTDTDATDEMSGSAADGGPAADGGALPGPAAAEEPGVGAPTSVGAEPGAAGVGGAVAEVVVHVAGAVAAPGVQRLPAGARVVDAVDAAGGAAPDADLGRINLAAVLADGQQVYVPRAGESPPAPITPSSGAPDGAAGTVALVDLNTATAAELEELPGVGPTTAGAIIAHREQHGPFGSVDDLLDVRGIGEAKLEQLRDLATV
jgi:competence protein ComEA